MDEKLINKAFLFTAKHFNESCHNFGKPVYFHSIKVGMKLFEMGYDEKIVIGGILHDVVEDTDCTLKDIEAEFGQEIAKLVDAVSFNPNIEDRFLQSKEMIDCVFDYGQDAMIIKCIDMYENAKFFKLVTNDEIKQYLIKKYRYFSEKVEKVIGDQPAFKLYKQLAETIG